MIIDKELFFKETNSCTCENPEFGFNCVCEHIKKYPGNINYCCEFCGLYTAAKPNCNKCKEEE